MRHGVHAVARAPFLFTHTRACSRTRVRVHAHACACSRTRVRVFTHTRAAARAPFLFSLPVCSMVPLEPTGINAREGLFRRAGLEALDPQGNIRWQISLFVISYIVRTSHPAHPTAHKVHADTARPQPPAG